MERQQTTLSNAMSNLSRRPSSFLLTGSWLPNTKKKKNLDTRCQSLQRGNEQLKEDVRCRSARCEILQNQPDNFYDWTDHFHGVRQSTDDKVDRLEIFFSERNNVRLFSVHEERDETDEDCVRKVVQLLYGFYRDKLWTRDDVDRATRTGPKSGDINRPRPLIARLHR